MSPKLLVVPAKLTDRPGICSGGKTIFVGVFFLRTHIQSTVQKYVTIKIAQVTASPITEDRSGQSSGIFAETSWSQYIGETL